MEFLPHVWKGDEVIHMTSLQDFMHQAITASQQSKMSLARECGISYTTFHEALHNKRRITPKTESIIRETLGSHLHFPDPEDTTPSMKSTHEQNVKNLNKYIAQRRKRLESKW